MSLKEETDTEAQIHERRMPCDDEGGDWSYAASSRESSKMASKPLEARKRQGRILSYPREVSEGA